MCFNGNGIASRGAINVQAKPFALSHRLFPNTPYRQGFLPAKNISGEARIEIILTHRVRPSSTRVHSRGNLGARNAWIANHIAMPCPLQHSGHMIRPQSIRCFIGITESAQPRSAANQSEACGDQTDRWKQMVIDRVAVGIHPTRAACQN